MAPIFLIPAMAADTIDYDELRTGKRREGQFSSFWVVIPKFVKIPGSAVPLAILAAVGYVPKGAQSVEVLFWIRFMYSIFPILFYVTGLAIISRYPLSEAIHEKIRDGIAALAGGGSVTDPITGKSITARGKDRVSEDDGWFLDHFAPGELKRTISSGASGVWTSVAVAAGISLLVCVGSGALALSGMTNPEARPPLTTVFAIVIAGLSFTFFVFHCLRLAPARQLADSSITDDVIEAHLDGVD
jgi:GPH family glycoside/pentoside/hexuronide:cation symporter